MCNDCNYIDLLKESGLGLTGNRLAVLEEIGRSSGPVSANELLEELQKTGNVNKVTVYRILDLLVEYGLVEKISSGDRSFRYGLGPNANHQPHPHFFCKLCGRMECIELAETGMDLEKAKLRLKGKIDSVQVRFDGVCGDCLLRKQLEGENE